MPGGKQMGPKYHFKIGCVCSTKTSKIQPEIIIHINELTVQYAPSAPVKKKRRNGQKAQWEKAVHSASLTMELLWAAWLPTSHSHLSHLPSLLPPQHCQLLLQRASYENPRRKCDTNPNMHRCTKYIWAEIGTMQRSIKRFRIIPHLSIFLLCHDCQGSVQHFLLLQKNWVWTKFLTNLKHSDLHAQSVRSSSYFLHQWRYVNTQALPEAKDYFMHLLRREDQSIRCTP
jgi:hypothetical protein